MTQDDITAYLNRHISVAGELLKESYIEQWIEIAGKAAEVIRNGGKLVLFGNGGSAADAQHIAAELVGRFKRERDAIPAVALTTNTSIISAIANDYAYDEIFARQVEAIVTSRDVVIGISTSGNSSSVIEGITAAKLQKAYTIGLTGRSGGKLKDYVDVCFMVPSDDTPLIQEMHITLGHALCAVLEDENNTINVKAKRSVTGQPVIRVIALDIDGVLTDGTVTINGENEFKSLFYRDMDAVNFGRREGLNFALLTAESTPMVEYIAKRLQIVTVIQGAKDKENALKTLSAKLLVPLSEICYIGDSRRDTDAIRIAGLGLAPADADNQAKQAATRVLGRNGGRGVVSEAIHFVLELNSLRKEKIITSTDTE